MATKKKAKKSVAKKAAPKESVAKKAAPKKAAPKKTAPKKTAPKKSAAKKSAAKKAAPKKAAPKKPAAKKAAPKKPAAKKAAPKKPAAKDRVAPEKLVASGGKIPAPVSPGDEASQRRQLRERIHVADLDAYAGAILAAVLPSLRLVRSGDEARIGGTRLGGLPDLPARAEWPRGPKAPLSFIAQLDLAEIGPLDASGLLPREGLLSFFYDLAGNPWGGDLAERALFSVLHTPGGLELQRRDKPADLVKPHAYAHVELTSTPVRAELELTVPSARTKEIRAFGFDQAEHDRYADELGAVAWKWPTSKGVMHRVLGHADSNQGDMTRRLAYLFAGKPDAIDDEEPDPVVEEDAARFRLLLQIDTDDDLLTHWGSGRLYFWIREEDLKAARFDATFFQFQG